MPVIIEHGEHVARKTKTEADMGIHGRFFRVEKIFEGDKI